MREKKIHPLKLLRVLFSISIFTILFGSFLGISLFTVISGPLQYIQFVPSLLRVFAVSGGIISFGFLGVILMTLIFGRVYCSFLCPLGVFQDVILFFKRWGKRGPFDKQKPRLIGYLILAGTAVVTIAGSAAVIDLLDPFAITGRFAGNIVKPMGLIANNKLAEIAGEFGYYGIQPVKFTVISLPVAAVSAGWMGLITVMVLFRNRFYCNTVCPVGALLSIFSRFSLYKVSIDKTTCTACGSCERTCRSGCIDSSSMSIDAARCVLCFDCLSICPEQAVRFRIIGTRKRGHLPRQKMRSPEKDPERRSLLTAVTLAAGGVSAGLLLRRFLGIAEGEKVRKTAVGGKNGGNQASDTGPDIPAFPPGGKSINHYLSRCVACRQCASVCPTRIIRPGLFEFGLRGMMVPVIDYSRGFCEYECNNCSHACPSQALVPLSLSEKKRTKIGTAVLRIEDCVVFMKREDCGACAEVCPTHAVATEPREGLFFPVMDDGPCIGCGACEYACPALPKAIFIDPAAIHGTAAPPKQLSSVKVKISEGDAGNQGRSAAKNRRDDAAKRETSPQDATEEEFPF